MSKKPNGHEKKDWFEKEKKSHEERVQQLQVATISKFLYRKQVRVRFLAFFFLFGSQLIEW